jgi:tricorn protease-like protein
MPPRRAILRCFSRLMAANPCFCFVSMSDSFPCYSVSGKGGYMQRIIYFGYEIQTEPRTDVAGWTVVVQVMASATTNIATVQLPVPGVFASEEAADEEGIRIGKEYIDQNNP